MVAVVGGNSLGLELTSLRTLGAAGVAGHAAHGRNGESVFVNSANGNLVVQDRDDVIAQRGPDAQVLRTYNSLGQFDDDNGDNWTDGLAPLPLVWSGTPNATTSTVTRTDRDGSSAVYAWNAELGAYVTTEGEGAYDTIRFVVAGNQYEWKDGSSGATQRYAAGTMRMVSSSDSAGNAVSYVYDASGRLAEAVASNGEKTVFERSGANITRILRTDAQGSTTSVRYTHDGDNRLSTVCVDLGPGMVYTTTYSYESGSKRLASLQQSDGTSLAFTYEVCAGAHRVKTVTDAAGATTVFSYDASGRMTSAQAAGLVTTFGMDAAGQLTSITPPGFGGQPGMQFTYDSAGNVTRVTDGAGRSTSYEYQNGNRTRERSGESVTDRFFNADNQLVWESAYTGLDPDGSGPIQATGAMATRFVYDGGGRNLLRFIVSPEGRVTEYRYDAFGNRLAQLAYAATCSIDPALPPDGLTLGAMQAWAIDRQAAVAERTDATFDARGQLLTRTTFTKVGADGEGIADGSQSVEHYIHDQRGLLLQKIAPSGATTAYTHDGLGRELTRLDAAGRLTVTQYQDSQRKTVVTAANGLVTTSTYDLAGRLVATLESSPAAANLGVTTYSYDAAGRLRMSVDPTGVRHFWLWDDAGRCVGEVDGTGTLTESTFDKGGLLVSKVTYANAVVASLLADPAGNAITAATISGVRPASSTSDAGEWRAYDASGRLLRVAGAVSTGSTAAVTAYGYDGAGRLVSETAYATSISIASIQPSSIPLPPASTQDRTTRYFHDNDGRLAGTLDAEGFLVRFFHDGAGRSTERVAYATATSGSLRASGMLAQLQPAATAADQRTVTLHDAKGQVVAVVDAENDMTEMAYDADGHVVRSTRYANRVTAAVSPSSTLAAIRPAAGSGDQVTTRVFDSLGRLQQETTPDGVTTVTAYDAGGNRVAITRAVATDEERSLRYRFDVQGRVTQELTAEGAALLTSGMSQAAIDQVWTEHALEHAYDLAGRRTSTTNALGARTLYYYDADGALVFTVSALGEVKESRYDGLGRETARVTRSSALGAAQLAPLTGGVVTDAVRSLLTSSTASDSTESLTYTRDGRVLSRTDGAGALTTFTHNAFGDVIGSAQQVSDFASVYRVFTVDRLGRQVSAAEDLGGLNLLTSAVHDAFGRVVSTTDATGKVSTRTYDRLGRTITLTDPLNATRSTSYDPFGRVLAQTDAMGAVTTYTHDMATRSVRVTTPEGVVTVTTTNRHGQVQSVTDGNGHTTSYAYDRNGRLVRTTTPSGTTTSSDYDRAGRLLQSIDANGHSVTYSYDAADRVLKRTVDPGGLGLVTEWKYDAKGQAVSVKDPNGIETIFAYDNAGRVLRQAVNPTGLNLQTVFTYDKRGKTLTVTSPQGTVTQYVYDAAGRRTAEIVNPTGLALTRTWAYDGEGRVVTATNGAGNVTRYAYDAAGRLLFTVDPTGGVQRQVYDAEGRVARTIAYANFISLTVPSALPAAASAAEIQARLSPQLQDQVEHRVYDRDGRLAATVDGTGAVVRYAYDAKGNVASRTAYANRITLAGWQGGTVPSPPADPAHDQKTAFVYDAADRVLFTVDGAGAVVEHAYDANGNVVRRTAYAQAIALPASITQASVAGAVVAAAARDVTVRSTYDAANRLVWTVDGTGAVARREYDRNGNVVRTTAYATAIAPTEAAQSVRASAQDDRVTTRYYDAAGRVVLEVDAVNAVRESFYDRDGHVVKQVAYASAAASVPLPTTADAIQVLRPQFVRSAAADRVTSFAWDAAGRLLAKLLPEGALTHFQYDAASRLVTTTAFESGLSSSPYMAFEQLLSYVMAGPGDRKTRTAYDAAGRVVYEVRGMGEVTGFAYDGAGRLVRTTRYANALPNTGLPIYTLGLPSSSGGMTAAQIAMALTPDAAKDRTQTSTFDAAGNLLSSTDANGATERFTYDALGSRLTFTNAKGAIWTYDRDAAGRVVQETSPQVELASAFVDASGEVAIQQGAPASVVTRFAFDALGNLTQRTEAAGRAEERATRYEYDPLGRQVKVIHPTVGTYKGLTADPLVTSGLASREETEAQLVSQTFHDALGNAVAGLDVGGKLSQKVHDRAGRVEYEIDALGQVTRYTRNAFGEVTALTRYAAATALAARTVESAADSATRSQVISSLAPGAQDRTVNTTYDRNGRVVKVEEPAALTFDPVTGGIQSAFRATTSTTYNVFGEATQVSRLGNAGRPKATTTHYFDKSGQEIATVDAMGFLTERAFDARGNLVTVKESAGAVSPGWTTATFVRPAASQDDRTTRFAYDRLDRKTSETRVQVEYSAGPNGTSTRGDLVTTYGYDALGNLTRTADASGASTFTAYDSLGRISAVAAPARPGPDDATLTPLTTFARDAHGQVVEQREWAAGAATAGEAGITPVGTRAGDRVTRTAYDSHGRAKAVRDAEGSVAYTSHDAWGHVAKTWRGVKDLDGVMGTWYQVNAYDAIGQLVRVVEPGPATLAGQAGIVDTVLQYDAFGDLTRKSVDGQVREYFDHDGAGRLWRTNTGDGVDRIRLFDAFGNVTSEITSSGSGGSNRNLAALSTAYEAAIDTSLRRTDITYDLLGRVTSRRLPSRVEAGSSVVAQRGYVGAAITESATPIFDETSNVLGTQGTNRVTLDWAGIAELGSGEVKVEMRYRSGPPDGRHFPVIRTWTSDVMDATAATVTANWIDSPYDRYGGITEVLQVIVRKKDVNGNWVVVLDQAPGYGSSSVDIAAPADHASKVVLEVRTAGSSGDSGWWAAPLVDFGDRYRFDASGLAVGGYEYRVRLVLLSGESRIVDTGSVSLDKPPLTAITSSLGYWAALPGTFTWASPPAATAQVFRYRAVGSTGGWNPLQVQHFPNVAKHGVDTSGLAAGNYEFELLWSPSSTGVPSSHAVGQLSIVAAVPPSWVPPQNVPPIDGLYLSTQGGRIDLVWNAAAADGASIRPLGGSWSALTIDNWGQTLDEAGGAYGIQGAILGYLSPGTYEVLVQAGSPATRQATVTVTVYQGTSGYMTYQSQPYWYSMQIGVDEYGYPIYTTVMGWRQIPVWVPGYTPPPALTVTTPPYVPGYMSPGSPAQYISWTSSAPGSQSISGTDGASASVGITSSESAHGVRPLVEQKSDRWGNVVEVTDPRSSAWKTTYRYNASNQLVRESHAGGAAGTAVTEFFYDKLGRQVAAKDARGSVSGQVFDAGGNLVREIHADSGMVRHDYDALGNRVRTTDPLGHVVTFEHDRLGRLLSRTQGAVNVYGTSLSNELVSRGLQQLKDSWTYDSLGRALTQQNGNGETLSYRYDLRGNVIETRQVGGQAVRAAYDAQGRKVAELDANGALATWTCDYFGRLRGHTDLDGASYAYDYDAAQQLVRQTSSRGQHLVFGFDAAGQQTMITDAALGKVTTYAYDLGGRKLREKVVQGGLVYQDNHLSYDGLGNLRDVADARVHLSMTYDLAGNRTRVTTSVNYQGNSGEATNTSDRWFVYDAMNRQVVVDGVDAAGNLGAQGHRIVYDLAGNRKSDTWWGNRVVVGSGQQYISTLDDNMNPVYAFAPATTYTATLGETTEAYEYDAANRLVSVRRDGVLVDARFHDGANRVVKSGPGTLPAGHAAAINQNVPASQAIGNETRINRYDANGRLLHQKILTSDGAAKSDISWDPTESVTVLGTVGRAAGYDGAGNVLGYVAHTPGVAPILTTYTNTLRKFDGYVAGSTTGTAPGSAAATTAQQYDVNGFLVGVNDPTRADASRTFVNDAAGRALFVNQAGRVQRQLVVGGEVLGLYGVGPDPVSGNANFANIADFDFGYSKITAAYPAATPGSYQVKPGDTLQSIAQSAYGDGKLWYRIADANGLASSAAMKVGQTLNIPSGVGTISNNAGSFKPYDASRIVGETTPLVMPAPEAADGGCGGMGKVLMVIVAVAVTAMTAGAPALNSFWSGVLSSNGAVAVATAATAAAVGSIASQGVGIITGTVEGFDWRGVALSAVSGGITQGLGGANPSITSTVARAAVANALSQGVGVVTGLQRRFDWRGVAASFVGTAVGQAVGAALGLSPNGNRGGMEAGEFVAKSAVKSFAAGLAASAARGGKVAVQQVAVDSFGSAFGHAFADTAETRGPALSKFWDFSLTTEARRTLLDAGVNPDAALSAPDESVAKKAISIRDFAHSEAAETLPSEFEIDVKTRRLLIAAGIDPEKAVGSPDRILSTLKAVFIPEFDGAQLTPTSEIGGHFRRPQLVGQAFVGVFSPRLNRVFTQQDLNLMVAHSQFADQLKDLDAVAAARRFLTGDEENRGALLPRLIQRGIHSLNSFGAESNQARVLDLLEKAPLDLALAGLLMHPYEDARPHAGHGSPLGHFWQSVLGFHPDYVTPENGLRGAKDMVKFFERALGVSADSPVSEGGRTIREAVTDDIGRALSAAGEIAVGGRAFERAFNYVVSERLPDGALRSPKLKTLNDPRGSTLPEALAKTSSYLAVVGLNRDPAQFLMESLRAAAQIVNHYMSFNRMRYVRPFTAEQFLRTPSPEAVLPRNSIFDR